MAIVPEPLRVTRDKLLQWAGTPEACGDLPRLLRSLIAETEPSAEWIDMPSGSGVAAPGWDGIVRCSNGNRFVPAGLSCWEASTERRRSHSKALNDYDKRVDGTPRSKRVDIAYVAAVCAPWTKAREFADEKSQCDDFRLVRALNVDHIEDWLECAPVSTVWLREVMDEPVAGIGLLSGWWSAWLDSTTVPLAADIVLAGRDEATSDLHYSCSQSHGGVITIGGGMHRDEILAFIAAALVEPSEDDSFRHDVLYIDDLASAQRLLTIEDPIGRGRSSVSTPGMTAVVPSDEFARYLPPDSQHRLIVPLPGSVQADIVLDAVDGSVVAKHLEAAGEDFHAAHGLGAVGRMSLLTLRRRLAVKPELHQPAWAAGSVDRTLRRSLLLNSWSQHSDGDADTVERFVGSSHDDLVEVLHSLTGASEPPMLLTDERWHVVAPADAWGLVSEQITRDELKLFADLAEELLTESDPFYGMDNIQRAQAQFEGTTARYSSHIKQGVATTLALLGSFPPLLRGDAAPAASAADGIVARILRRANDDTDPTKWASVAEALPLLVEAAPDAVLAGLRSCLSGAHPFALGMFADSQANEFGLPSASPHIHVLDALEVLAWSEAHFEAVVDVLAGLAALDPGGRWSNRPSNSLESIMCSWAPQTSANGEARLQALDMLRNRHSPVAWELMLAMLPSGSDSVVDKRGPRYRRWKDTEPVVTRSEHLDTVCEVAVRLVLDAETDSERLQALVERAGDLSADARMSLRSVLKDIAESDPDEDHRCALWPALRRMIGKQREWGESDGALSATELEQFEVLQDRLRPSDPLTTYGMLFDGGLGSIDGVSPLDHEAYREVRTTRQTEAVEAIHDSGGIAAVLDFAASARDPLYVGEALAATGSDVDEEMLAAMNSAPETVIQVALGYFASRFRDYQWGGIDRLITRHSPSAQVTADLIRACPPNELPWRKANELGTEVAEQYWARVDYWSLGCPEALCELLEVAGGLREAGRADFAAWLLSLRLDSLASQPKYAEEAASCLEAWSRQEGPRTSPFDRYGLVHLLSVLDQHVEHLGTDRVLMIEWQYYPGRMHNGAFKSPNLYRRMAQDPTFFASLVEIAFRPASSRSEDPPEPSAAEQEAARKAYGLLDSWPPIGIAPGIDEDGKVDRERLDHWVEQARTLLSESDRAVIGDQKIGKALAASPPGPDGEWPSTEVCDLIERLQSDDVELGLSIAIRSQRGVTSRAPSDGGDQERNLAEKYRQASSRLSTSPRTKAIFEGLAAGYEEEAAMHDRQAEANRRGLPL